MSTSRKSVLNYRKKAYDFIQVSVPKGEREIIKEHAAKMGMGLNEFVKNAIKRQIEEDEKAWYEQQKK